VLGGAREDTGSVAARTLEVEARDKSSETTSTVLPPKMASRTARPNGEEQPGDQGGDEGPNKSPSLPPGKGRRRLLDSAHAVIRRRW
jgi:hypothetical protein